MKNYLISTIYFMVVPMLLLAESTQDKKVVKAVSDGLIPGVSWVGLGQLLVVIALLVAILISTLLVGGKFYQKNWKKSHHFLDAKNYE